MKKFLLEMLTPEKIFFKGEVKSVSVPSLDGNMGVLAHHTPMVIGLQSGQITIDTGEQKEILANGEGFMVIRPEKTAIFCQTMEWPEEIEINRVNRAIEEHQRKIREAKSISEYKVSKATLARALARLKVKINKY
ncbi:MAG TPA: ATP synthase F1 subunit epsilon [Clostridiales bacterium]|nr:ATP synthase F1 subunit epsilon [Clostridiales bacterium]